MARPGFVLDVDERTPPVLVAAGDTFRLERLPIGARVVYPNDSLPAVHRAEAIKTAFDAPVGSDPLDSRLRPGMRLTIAFSDNTAPVPGSSGPDLRAKIVEAVLTRAAKAGVDDVVLVAAIGLNRRQSAAELKALVGERVFRSFYADGLLVNHDAEDVAELAEIGAVDDVPILINRRVAESDLVVAVQLATTADESGPRGNSAAAVLHGLGGAATLAAVGAVDAPADLAGRAAKVVDQLPVFAVAAVLDAAVFPEPLNFLAKREWEWTVADQARWFGLRRATAAVPPGKLRRRILGRMTASWQPIGITGGSLTEVGAETTALVRAQQLVSVRGQADVVIAGVPGRTGYSVDAPTNPVLAAWSGLTAALGSHTGKSVVRDGGAVILFNPLGSEFSPLYHPAYVDFFAEVLINTTDPARIAAEFEAKFATDPWYANLYQNSHAFHGLHPVHRWYEVAAATKATGDVVWVGADRANAERLGFRAASTLADALEIVSSSVGRSPQITYLHTPPQILVDVQ